MFDVYLYFWYTPLIDPLPFTKIWTILLLRLTKHWHRQSTCHHMFSHPHRNIWTMSWNKSTKQKKCLRLKRMWTPFFVVIACLQINNGCLWVVLTSLVNSVKQRWSRYVIQRSKSEPDNSWFCLLAFFACFLNTGFHRFCLCLIYRLFLCYTEAVKLCKCSYMLISPVLIKASSCKLFSRFHEFDRNDRFKTWGKCTSATSQVRLNQCRYTLLAKFQISNFAILGKRTKRWFGRSLYRNCGFSWQVFCLFQYVLGE